MYWCWKELRVDILILIRCFSLIYLRNVENAFLIYASKESIFTFIFFHRFFREKFLNYIFSGTRTLQSATLLTQNFNFLFIWILQYFSNLNVINTRNFIYSDYLTHYVNSKNAWFNPTLFFSLILAKICTQLSLDLQ
jgi:hypothetical protein